MKTIGLILCICLVALVGCNSDYSTTMPDESMNITKKDDQKTSGNPKDIFDSIEIGESRINVLGLLGQPKSSETIAEHNSKDVLTDRYEFEDYKFALVFVYENNVLVDKNEAKK